MCANASDTAGDGTRLGLGAVCRSANHIGYWLKELDRRIEETLDRTLVRSEGVTAPRLAVPQHARDAGPHRAPRWSRSCARSGARRPFGPDTVLEGLTERGWALRDASDRYALSPEGETARAALLERVNQVRGAIADGVSPEQYNTTIDTLARMAVQPRSAELP